MFKANNQVEELLGGMSPLQAKSQSDHGSVSFAGKPSSSGMSIDSMSNNTSSTQRAPLGEVQNTFEFKPMNHQQGPQANKVFNPFTVGMRQPAAASGDSTRIVDRQSPEPATPASITSESRGSLSGPPLTTLASLTKMSPSDSDTVTPMASMHTSHVPLSACAVTPEPPKKSSIVWQDILMWKEPLQSATIFIAGLAVFWLVTFAAYGAHKMTFMSGVSYLLILDLFFNFFRYFVSKSWHEQCLWGGAAQMKHFLTRLNAHVLHLAAAHDRYMSAVDPFITLKVAGALWATAWIGSFLNLWWGVLLAYIGAFTLPVTYEALKPSLEACAKTIRAHTIDRIDAAGLPRTVRFLFCVAAVATLWMTTTFTQSAIGFFVACTYWRTLLAPREIDAFRTVAEPYTASAFKVGRRISTAASDMFDRMSTAGPQTRTKSRLGKQRMD